MSSQQIQEKDKRAGSCPRHHCTSRSCIAAFGPREHRGQLWPRLASLGSWGKDKASLLGNVMVSSTSQDTGFSRKQAQSAFPQPATAVAWSGAKSLEASGDPAVPKWLQGHSGGQA